MSEYADAEWFGRIIFVFISVLIFIFLGYTTLAGNSIELYDTSSQEVTDSFPPWNVSGGKFNGTTNNTDGELIINGSSTGTYTYTGPILEDARFLQPTDFVYRSSIREDQDQSIVVKIYTSDDGFKSIEDSQSFTLDDGVGSRVVDLAKAKDVRVQVLLEYTGSGTEPKLESLTLESKSISIRQDYSIFFEVVIFLLLLVTIILAAVSIL